MRFVSDLPGWDDPPKARDKPVNSYFGICSAKVVLLSNELGLECSSRELEVLTVDRIRHAISLDGPRDQAHILDG